jgi:O-antigen/teichoic acid export membrane protein
MKAIAISYAGFVGAFVASVVSARLLGVEGKGIFSLFLASLGGLAVAAALGVPQGQMYHASKNQEWQNHFMTNGVLFSTIVGTTVAAAYFLGGRAIGFKAVAPFPWPVLLAGIVAVPVSLMLGYQRQYFLVLHRFELAKASAAISQTLPVIGYLGLYLAGYAGVATFVGVYVGSQLVCYAAFQAPLRRVGVLQAPFSKELARRSLSFGSRHFVSDIALYLTSRLDFFIVMLYLGGKQLGIYSVAVGLAEVTVRLSNEIGTMLFPIFAGGSLRAGQSAAALRMVTLLAVGVAVVLALLSRPLVRVLFGEEFMGAVPAFRWLLLGTIAWSTTNVTWPYMSARGRPGVGVFVFGLAAGVDCALNLVLLPRWGVVGAGIAATSSYFVAALIFLRLFRKAEGCTLREALLAGTADLLRLWRVILQSSGRVTPERSTRPR